MNDIEEMRMESGEKHKLYREAVAFYELAECGRKNIPEKDFVESYIPYIVNMAFCTELLLKLLLIGNGKTIGDVRKLKHDLNTLYENLTQTQKSVIYQLFKKPLIYSIDEEIKAISAAFVDWRYLVLDKADGGSKKLRYKPYFIKELNEVLVSICENELGTENPMPRNAKHNSKPFCDFLQDMKTAE